MFEIENIDIKAVKRTTQVRKPYSAFGTALMALEIGQSFLAPDSLGKTDDYFSGTISQNGKRLGRKFSMRRVEGGYRIGRVA